MEVKMKKILVLLVLVQFNGLTAQLYKYQLKSDKDYKYSYKVYLEDGTVLKGSGTGPMIGEGDTGDKRPVGIDWKRKISPKCVKGDWPDCKLYTTTRAGFAFKGSGSRDWKTGVNIVDFSIYDNYIK